MAVKVRHRAPWAALYGLICLVEFALIRAKDYVAGKMTEKPPETPK